MYCDTPVRRGRWCAWGVGVVVREGPPSALMAEISCGCVEVVMVGVSDPTLALVCKIAFAVSR